MSAPARTTASDRGWTICFGPSELGAAFRLTPRASFAMFCSPSPSLAAGKMSNPTRWSPGWVATKMGGPSAPDDLQQGCITQVWLAASEDILARSTGGYFYHQRPRATGSSYVGFSDTRRASAHVRNEPGAVVMVPVPSRSDREAPAVPRIHQVESESAQLAKQYGADTRVHRLADRRLLRMLRPGRLIAWRVG
jgi:hypothetical protein